MAACAGNLESSLGGLLAAHILKIQLRLLSSREQGRCINLERLDSVTKVNEPDHVHQRPYRIDIDPADHRRLTGIDFGNDQARNFSSASLDRDGKRPSDSTNTSVQR